MKFISHIIKAVILISMLFAVVGCGDEEPLPYMVDIVGGPIDWTDNSEDGMLFMQVTIFDDQGVPATDGNVIFTLNETARGSLAADGAVLKSLSVDIEDSDVVEALFYASKAPETVTITVYIPGYPVDKAVSRTITVINDTVEADFVYEDLGNQIIQFHDRSGYADEEAVPAISWDFSDSGTASPQTSTDRDPICEYAAAGTYDVVLTVGGSTKTYAVVVP